MSGLIGCGLPAASTVRVGDVVCACAGRGVIKMAALDAKRIAPTIRARSVRVEFGCMVRSLEKLCFNDADWVLRRLGGRAGPNNGTTGQLYASLMLGTAVINESGLTPAIRPGFAKRRR